VTMARYLESVTIYDHPSDHPEHYVVRFFHVTADGLVADPHAYLFHTLEEARQIPAARGMFRFERAEADDPVIVESWM